MTGRRKPLIFFGSIIGCALLVLLLCVIKASILLLQRQYEVPPTATTGASAPPDGAHGGYLVHKVLGCAHCHAVGLAGRPVFDAGWGTLHAPAAAQWPRQGDALARILRFGIDADGRAVWLHPSARYQALADDDVRDIVRYVQSLPHNDTPVVAKALSVRGRLAYLLGVLRLSQSETAVRAWQQSPAPPSAPQEPVARGKYVAQVAGCTTCHGGNVPYSILPPPWAPAPSASLASLGTALQTGIAAPVPWHVFDLDRRDQASLVAYVRTLAPSD